MRKKSLALLLVLVMLLGLAAPSAVAAEPEETVVGVLETTVQEALAEVGVSTYSTGSVELASGNHERWIDRIDGIKTGSYHYAYEFYEALEDAADANDGGWLATLSGDSTIVEKPFSDSGDITAYQIYVGNADVNTAADYISAAYAAFDRDHPEVFWLSGSSSYVMTSSPSGSYVYFILKNEDGFDIRKSEYQDASAIESGISSRNSDVHSILNGSVTVDGETLEYNRTASDYDNVRYFNAWLTHNNAYNSNVNSAPADAWECVSALLGRWGDEGPVCEGYARAFKVLCDEAGIPCVLVDGKAINSTNRPEAHMWNYVQMEDGKWYAVDVTWNDPTGHGSGAASGGEREDYLLVGSKTVVDSREFLTSHPVSNQVTEGGQKFTNGPKLEDNSYTPPAEVTELTVTATYNGKTDTTLYIDVPTKGKTVEVTLTAKATYSDETPSETVDAVWKIEGNPWGVEISDNKLIIYPSASNPGQTARVQVSASYGGQTAYVTLSLVKDSAIVTSFDILGPDSITIPNSGSNTAQYFIKDICDQYGGTMSVPDNVQWSISDVKGVSVDSNGVVTVTDEAASGTATLTATCSSVHKDFSIDIRSKENAEVTITGVPEDVVKDDSFQLNANVDGFDPDASQQWTSSNEDVLSIINSGTEGVFDDSIQAYVWLEAVGSGTATITFTCEDDTRYGQDSVIITVLKKPTLGDFDYTLPQSVEYDGAAHAVTVTPKDNNMKYTVLYNNKEDEPVNAGTYTVTLQVEKANGYAAATFTLGTLTIDKATPTITVNDSLTMVKGTNRNLGAAIDLDGLTLQYSSSNTRVATVDANGTITAVAEGTATITVSYAGDNNHEPATATVTVTVTDKTPVTVTFADAADKTYDPNGYALGAQFSEATVDGDKPITKYIYNGTDYATLSALPTVKDAGTYTVTAVYESDTEYGSKDAAFTITKATPTITVNDSLTMVKGTTQSLSPTTDPADLSLEYTSSNSGVAKVSNDGTITAVAEGTATITVSYAGDNNHEPATATVTVTVTDKTPVTVTFANAADKTYDPNGYALGEQFSEATTTATGGGTITYTYGEKEYTSLDALPTVKDAGTYTVTAVYDSETEHGEATATFTINKANQAALTITSASTVTYGDTLTLIASGGSGSGAVTFAVTGETGKATVSGSTLTPVQSGDRHRHQGRGQQL